MSTVNLEPSGVLQLCPGSNITFVCTNNQSAVIAWSAYDENYDPDGDPCFFSVQSKIGMTGCTSGNFTILLISTSPLVSTATLKNKFDPQQNGTILVCSNTLSSNPSPSQMENAVLTLKGTQYAVYGSFLVCVCVCVCLCVCVRVCLCLCLCVCVCVTDWPN